MSRKTATLAAGLSLALLAGWAGAHVRLVHISNGRPLGWSSTTDITLVINDQGSDDVSDASDDVAIRLAMDSWNEVDGTNLSLVEDPDPAQRSRTDWESHNVHLVMFDEDGSTGWFPNGSGTVAVTPIFFDGNGQIQDADILLNGDDYSFTTSGEALRFDVQDVVTHEMGHFMGLDHSGCAGAAMHPYVDHDNILHRSPSMDDRAGLRQIAPAGSYARLTGSVRRDSDNSVVVGAYVVATDDEGRASAGSLTNSGGAFSIEGLLPDVYTVTVVPLDEPVSAGNLTSWYTIQTDFEPTSYPASVTVGSGVALALGTVEVADDVSINLGKASDRYPLRAVIGDTTSLTVRGNGLYAGGTLTTSDSNVVITPQSWWGSQVVFQVTVPFGESLGLIDLEFIDSIGRRAFLPGALELTPPDPTVSTVAPTVATNLGGTGVFISGSGFRPGARVVIGDRWYSESSGLSVLNSSTIEVLTSASELGIHDIVVIDESGVEGRLTNGFEYKALPSLNSILPAAGDVGGGTTLSIGGENFQSGVIVRIDGVVQGNVTILSSTELAVVTSGGSAGVTTLEVENPGAGSDSTTFEYVPLADPGVQALDPVAGPNAGGTVIEFTGENLAGVTEVRFGADLAGGGAGQLGTLFQVVDSTTVRVSTPTMAAGVADVLLWNPSSGQGVLLTGAFTFEAPASSGGGCGSVPFVPFAQRPGPMQGLWLGVLALIVGLRAYVSGSPKPKGMSER